MFVVILTVMPFMESVDVAVDGSGHVPYPRLVVGLPVSPLSVPPMAVVAVMMVGWWVALSPFLPLLVIFAGAAVVLMVLLPGAACGGVVGGRVGG